MCFRCFLRRLFSSLFGSRLFRSRLLSSRFLRYFLGSGFLCCRLLRCNFLRSRLLGRYLLRCGLFGRNFLGSRLLSRYFFRSRLFRCSFFGCGLLCRYFLGCRLFRYSFLGGLFSGRFFLQLPLISPEIQFEIRLKHFALWVHKAIHGAGPGSNTMNTVSPPHRLCCGRLWKWQGKSETSCAVNPKKGPRRIGIQSRGFRRSCVLSSDRSSRSSKGKGFPRWGRAVPSQFGSHDGWRCNASSL